VTAAVAAVVVFHESGESILSCVRSLLTQTRPPESVVVVANSAVPTEIDSQLRGLGVEMLAMKSNVGFGAACNAGAKHTDQDYIWFVNPDLVCEPHCLETLLREVGDGAVVVGPAIWTSDGRLERSVKSDSYVSAPILLSRELLVGRRLHVGSPTPPTRTANVDVVSGACLLLPRDLFWSVGGFDESYFLYGEDVDLCLRLRRSGAEIKYVPDAAGVHDTGTGAGGIEPSRQVLEVKGREARRSHALLLERFADQRAVDRYHRGLAVILPLRIAVHKLLGRRDGAAKDIAAREWLAEVRGRG
jgi:N-acetylglucosaminyl-diphospho-decaprenol L-rhamnosyltransferase